MMSWVIATVGVHGRARRRDWHCTGERSRCRACRVEHGQSGNYEAKKSTAADHDFPLASYFVGRKAKVTDPRHAQKLNGSMSAMGSVEAGLLLGFRTVVS